MDSVPVSPEAKEIVQRHVAAGTAASEADFIERAVRLYAGFLDEDETALVAAAQQGIEAIERGEYIEIASEADREAFWQGVWKDARAMAAEMRKDNGPPFKPKPS